MVTTETNTPHATTAGMRHVNNSIVLDVLIHFLPLQTAARPSQPVSQIKGTLRFPVQSRNKSTSFRSLLLVFLAALFLFGRCLRDALLPIVLQRRSILLHGC